MSEQEPHDIDKTPLAWFVGPGIAMALTGLWGWAGLIADRDRSWPQLVDSLAASATVAAVAVAAYLLQRVGQRVNRRQITATRAVVDEFQYEVMAAVRDLLARTEALASLVQTIAEQDAIEEYQGRISSPPASADINAKTSGRPSVVNSERRGQVVALERSS